MTSPMVSPIKPPILMTPIMSPQDRWIWESGGFVIDFTEGTLGASGSAPSVSRSGATASRFNSSRNLEADLAANTPRFAHDFATGQPLGLRVEGTCDNKYTNNTFANASTSPSTLPTGFAVESGVGLSTTVEGLGTENGIPYMDLLTSGTASGTVYQLRFGFGTTASTGQIWTASTFWKFISGSTNVSNASINIREAGGAFLATATNVNLASTSLTRYAATRTFANNQPAQWLYRATVTNGASINFRYRLGMPQLEQKGFATSLVRTPNAAAVRNPDIVTMPFTGGGKGLEVVSFRVDGTQGTQPVLQIDDGTDNNRIHLVIVSGVLYARCTVSGSNTADINLGSVAANTLYTVCFSHDTDDFRAAVNGGTPGTDVSGALPGGLTTLRYGSDVAGNYLFGTIASHRHLPQTGSSARVQALSL